MTELSLWTNKLLEFGTFQVLLSLLLMHMFPTLTIESGTTESQTHDL